MHGEVDRLKALHGFLSDRFTVGDRLVYLGNFIGHGADPRATVDEMIAFRRHLLGRSGMLVGDIVYLRGQQEEMWHKLLQLQFASNPFEVLQWMLRHGLEPTLAGYQGNSQDGLACAREGAVQLTRWTGRLREAMRAAAGHGALYNVLRRAAFTEPSASRRDNGMLLVSAGLDPSRSLSAQGDAFWWDQPGFAGIDKPFEGFGRVVRGLGDQAGIAESDFTLTLDSGCGRGGSLAAARLSPAGKVEELFEI